MSPFTAFAKLTPQEGYMQVQFTVAEHSIMYNDFSDVYSYANTDTHKNLSTRVTDVIFNISMCTCRLEISGSALV